MAPSEKRKALQTATLRCKKRTTHIHTGYSITEAGGCLRLCVRQCHAAYQALNEILVSARDSAFCVESVKGWGSGSGSDGIGLGRRARLKLTTRPAQSFVQDAPAHSGRHKRSNS